MNARQFLKKKGRTRLGCDPLAWLPLDVPRVGMILLRPLAAVDFRQTAIDKAVDGHADGLLTIASKRLAGGFGGFDGGHGQLVKAGDGCHVCREVGGAT